MQTVSDSVHIHFFVMLYDFGKFFLYFLVLFRILRMGELLKGRIFIIISYIRHLLISRVEIIKSPIQNNKKIDIVNDFVANDPLQS